MPCLILQVCVYPMTSQGIKGSEWLKLNHSDPFNFYLIIGNNWGQRAINSYIRNNCSLTRFFLDPVFLFYLLLSTNRIKPDSSDTSSAFQWSLTHWLHWFKSSINKTWPWRILLRPIFISIKYYEYVPIK